MTGKRRFIRNSDVREIKRGPYKMELLPGGYAKHPPGWVSVPCGRNEHGHCYALKCACACHGKG